MVFPSFIDSAKEELLAALKSADVNPIILMELRRSINNFLADLYKPDLNHSEQKAMLRALIIRTVERPTKAIVSAEEQFFRTVELFVELHQYEGKKFKDRLVHHFNEIRIELTKQFGDDARKIEQMVQFIKKTINDRISLLQTHNLSNKRVAKRMFRQNFNRNIPSEIEMTTRIKVDIELLLRMVDQYIDTL